MSKMGRMIEGAGTTLACLAAGVGYLAIVFLALLFATPLGWIIGTLLALWAFGVLP